MNYHDTGIEILNTLNANGFEAFFVGGYVRDTMLNLPANDIDITTSAFPEDIKKIFDHVVDKGISYNSVLIILNGFEFEVTTYRTDISYEDFRHPIVGPASNLAEDLKRRDFTINAMAMDKNGSLIDLYHGMNDLEKKIIRAVGVPSVRFNEDALRMLRAFYFSAKLDFEIDLETLSGINDNAQFIGRISSERILAELDKMIKQKNSLKGFKYLALSKLNDYLPCSNKAVNLISNNNIKVETIEELLTLFFYFDSANQEFYKLSNKSRKLIDFALKNLKENLSLSIIYRNDIESLKLLNKVKEDLGLDFIEYEKIVSMKDSLVINSRKDINITTKDLIETLKLTPGPWIEDFYTKIENDILEGNLENKKETIILSLKKDCSLS